jgi:hypothetical protein
MEVALFTLRPRPHTLQSSTLWHPVSLILKEELSMCLQTRGNSKQLKFQWERLKNSNSVIVVLMTQSRNFGDFMKPNKELLPKENFIKISFSIIMKIQKIWGREAIISRVQTWLKDLRIFRLLQTRICLTLSTFGNSISSIFLETLIKYKLDPIHAQYTPHTPLYTSAQARSKHLH